MSTSDVLYPYDPSGSLASNRIISEAIDVIDPGTSRRAMFVIPKAAPFFADTLEVKNTIGAGAATLIEGTDYILTHMFHAATDAISRRVMGSILFLNKQYVGRLYITYQTLGGDHTLDDVRVAEELTRDLYSIRTVAWDQIKVQIVGFPPYGHDHVSSNLIGLGELVDSTERIAAAILDSGSGSGGGTPGGGGGASLQAHIAATTNAHSKGAVGLGNVENYGVATMYDVANNMPNKYITPVILRQAIATYSVDLSDIQQRLQQMQSIGVDLNQYKTTVNAQIVTINSSISTVNSSVEDINDNMLAIAQIATENTDAVLDLTDEVNTAKTDITDLKTFRTEANDQINELTDDLNDVENRVDTLEDEVDSLSDKVGQGFFIDSTGLKPATDNGFVYSSPNYAEGITKVFADGINNDFLILSPYYVNTYIHLAGSDNASGANKLYRSNDPLNISSITTAHHKFSFEYGTVSPISYNSFGALEFSFAEDITTVINYDITMTVIGNSNDADGYELLLATNNEEVCLADSSSSSLQNYYKSAILSTTVGMQEEIIEYELGNPITYEYLVEDNGDPIYHDLALVQDQVDSSLFIHDNPLYVDDDSSPNNRAAELSMDSVSLWYIRLPPGVDSSRVYVVDTSTDKVISGSGRWSGNFIIRANDITDFKIQLSGDGDTPVTSVRAYKITLGNDSTVVTYRGSKVISFKKDQPYYFYSKFSEYAYVQNGLVWFSTDVSDKVRAIASSIKLGV